MSNDVDRMIEAGEIEFANGYKVKFRRIQPGLFLAFAAAHPEPEVPKREVKVPGGTEMIDDEENPEYQLAYAMWNHRTGAAWLELVFRHLEPELPDNADWLEDMEAYRIKVPESKKGRGVLYLKCVAMNKEDIALASSVIARASGVTEARVDEALETFRSDLGGDTDNGSGSEGGVPASGEQGEPPAASAQDDGADALGVDVDNAPNRGAGLGVRTKRKRQVRRR